ncbi:MAG: 3-phosphoserine/phosphohydroxythreonine transaminase [Bacteroidales bacterium]|nr:3-phosphoserine/phosphohydroxythreonine transaminase [Bacteroidales bacterium]MBN2764365.1 3-phosphoserine/phosphohydroxythreonine transaminase [Bacteroidales bacterium]
MKKYNFNPGPSILPEFTIKNTAEAVLNLNGSGLSVMEISHRSKDFVAIMDKSVELMKEILSIPDGYSVVFLHGGASLQFLMIPYNFLNTKAAYLDTGSWASKAIKEAKELGEVVVVASSKESNYNHIPRNYTIPADVDYFHITTNNTIFGTEIKHDMDSPVPLIADASSDILSRPMDVSKYSLIYAGAQKNLGPAGVAVVIIKDTMLEKIKPNVPTMLNYKIHVDNNSLYNTPPCLAVYACLQTLIWLKDMGGLNKIHKVNLEKAKLLYDEIDSNRLFVPGVTDAEDRSVMNVTFVMKEEYKDMEAKFLEFASSQGLIGIKGHRSVGGFRASIYNAMSLEGVQALVNAMKDFAKQV